VAVTAAQTRPDRGTAPGNLVGTFCGPIRSVPPVRGPAAGQAGEQMAPSLLRHTRGTKVSPGLAGKAAVGEGGGAGLRP